MNMKKKEYNPCEDCGGEDCVCCEVWLEQQADDKYSNGREDENEDGERGFYGGFNGDL